MPDCSIGRAGIWHRLPEPRRVGALLFKFLLDYFTRLCPNTALKQT